ncbi:MAG: methyltransferase domain-containing protein [Clostridia bacterium]|nr:methyltransferase domain-containing protein [Clostridia bacterium]
MDYSKLSCPICQGEFTKDGNALRCCNGHCFDIASEGYVNLLPANFKKTQLPGDNKVMVNARRDFLGKGFFAPLALSVAQRLMGASAILDAGCGTGWYGSQIKSILSNGNTSPYVCGIDISKFAVRLAAKSGVDCAAVGSVFNLPLKDCCFDAALTVFAPLCADELFRVCKKGATVVTVNPAERHLIELKQAMYGIATYENPPENAQKPLVSSNGDVLFEHTHSERLTFSGRLEGASELSALLSMTPYLYKTGEEQKSHLLSLNELSCTFDFYIDVYKKA